MLKLVTYINATTDGLTADELQELLREMVGRQVRTIKTRMSDTGVALMVFEADGAVTDEMLDDRLAVAEGGRYVAGGQE